MLVDSREPEPIRDWLTKRGHEVRVLPYSDYWICPHIADRFTAIERKRTSDLIASMQDGRMARLYDSLSMAAATVLLVEGPYSVRKDGKVGIGRRKTGIPHAAVMSALIELIHNGVHIIWNPSNDPLTTARLLDKIDEDLKSGHESSLLDRRRKRKPRTRNLTAGQQALVDLNIGIGPTKATLILEGIDLSELAVMSRDQLAELPGIGPAIANRIFLAFHTKG